MRCDEIFDNIPYLLQVKLRRSVWVHHRGMEDVFAVFSHQGMNGQFLNIDVGANQGRQLRWQIANEGGLNAPVIYQARHLGGTGRRQ